MFDESRPPVMRGDLFALLDQDTSEQALTPERISEGARALVERVSSGDRGPGVPGVMHCLNALAQLGGEYETARAFGRLTSIRQQLVDLSETQATTLPWPVSREQTIVLPQKRSATLLRVVPTKTGYFVLTCEAAPAERDAAYELLLDEMESEESAGKALVPPVEVTYKLFRFGQTASDIRMIMRIVQEPRTFRTVICAGDGERLAVLSRDVIGVFDDDGKVALSGRVPLDQNPEAGAEVTALAVQGDVLALNIRPGTDRPVELALLNLAEKRGFPIGTVGQEAGEIVLGPKQAYILDGLNLVRIPLFNPEDTQIQVFGLRPWFAEYPWQPRKMLAYANERVWISNGRKLIVLSADMGVVLGEIVLEEPIVDFEVFDDELSLVTFDREVAMAKVVSYRVD
ncbi:MAG: hypothetical protein ACI9MR_001229 [Myxococcota bacterium]|jgi:hypothetical protein